MISSIVYCGQDDDTAYSIAASQLQVSWFVPETRVLTLAEFDAFFLILHGFSWGFFGFLPPSKNMLKVDWLRTIAPRCECVCGLAFQPVCIPASHPVFT